MHTPSLVPLSLLFHVYSVFAVKFAFQARHTVNRLQRRANISGQPIANTHNAEYISNITLGGKPISVMLDTGRYVECYCIPYLTSYARRTAPTYGSPGLSQDRQTLANRRHCPMLSDKQQVGKLYLISLCTLLTSHLGDINTATLTFDNYTVNAQAYLLVTNTSAFSTDIEAQGYSGLVGENPIHVCKIKF
jgi:hypothetical protein